MKYLALSIVIASAMAANMVADLNFADETHDARGWDFICAGIIGLTFVVLLAVVILDTIRDLDR